VQNGTTCISKETAMRSILALFFLTLATPALAVDGVLEINQTCAVQTGCFAGDTAGFPVTIDGSGGRSYRLTSDLIVPNENTDGILFSTSDIGIDLNNFAIIGAGCVGSVTNCTPTSGTGSGIERNSALNRGVSVKNGSITGMGRFGVFIGDQGHITNISVRWNREDGINTSSGSTISGNTAYQNGRHGINAFTAATISGNTVSLNGDHGITAISSSTVSGNTANQNGGHGIDAGIGSTVSGNTANQNGTRGIDAQDGSVVSDNTARGNETRGIVCGNGCTVTGNAAFSNGTDGISAGDGSTVQRNAVSFNGDHGLRLSSYLVSYGENVISNNTLDTVIGGTDAGGNVCNGSLTCP
jgi:parallel beta-helix repeat protein